MDQNGPHQTKMEHFGPFGLANAEMQFAMRSFGLQFPNAVVLNAVVCKRAQMSAKGHKRAQKSAKASPQKSAKEETLPTGLKQPGLGTPNLDQNGRFDHFGPFCPVHFLTVPQPSTPHRRHKSHRSDTSQRLKKYRLSGWPRGQLLL